MKRLIATFLATAVFAGAADAATFKPIAQGKSLVMTGKVVAGDAERLKEARIASFFKYGYAPERIFLNSPGGNVLAGIEVADAVIKSGMHTVVGRTDTCASICVLVFAAASHRVVFPTSSIVVHSASPIVNDANGNPSFAEDNDSMAVTLVLARLMKSLGTPDSVIVKMVTTPGGGVAYLNADDVAGWVEMIDG